VAAILAPLRDCIDAWWCASIDGSRGQSGARLAEQVRHHVKAPVVDTDSVAAACKAAAAAAKTGDRVVVFGSFHTVGPALEWLEAVHPPQAQAPAQDR
jgi:dihydrofolate synthase/folylpolyglutamate synthase